MGKGGIAVYELYGEAHSGAFAGAIHVERLEVRSHPHAWTILAHRHATLSQLFFIESGGGAVEIDGRSHAIAPPCLIWLPAGAVHGFRFLPGTEGAVATAAADFVALALAASPDLAPGLETPAVARLGEGRAPAEVGQLMAGLEEEARAAAPAGRAAMLHRLALLLIALVRASAPGLPARVSAAGRIAQGFRRLVETRYRGGWSLPDYAAALGVSADRLHGAVREATGQTPGAIVHERLMAEARRALLYTSQPVSRIAYDLGFEDAAYFSRFFARRAGVSPTAFRTAPDKAAEVL